MLKTSKFKKSLFGWGRRKYNYTEDTELSTICELKQIRHAEHVLMHTIKKNQDQNII